MTAETVIWNLNEWTKFQPGRLLAFAFISTTRSTYLSNPSQAMMPKSSDSIFIIETLALLVPQRPPSEVRTQTLSSLGEVHASRGFPEAVPSVRVLSTGFSVLHFAKSGAAAWRSSSVSLLFDKS